MSGGPWRAPWAALPSKGERGRAGPLVAGALLTGLRADRVHRRRAEPEEASEDPKRAAHYIELDLPAEAEHVLGKPFADFLEKNCEPVGPLFRPAEQTSVVLLNGGGLDGPEWSVRVPLANLDDLDHLKIGHHLRAIFDAYAEERRAGNSSPSDA